MLATFTACGTRVADVFVRVRATEANRTANTYVRNAFR